MEVPSPATGTLLAVFFQAGDDVPVMTTIAVIGQPGEDWQGLAPDGEKWQLLIVNCQLLMRRPCTAQGAGVTAPRSTLPALPASSRRFRRVPVTWLSARASTLRLGRQWPGRACHRARCAGRAGYPTEADARGQGHGCRRRFCRSRAGQWPRRAGDFPGSGQRGHRPRLGTLALPAAPQPTKPRNPRLQPQMTSSPSPSRVCAR